MSFDKGTYVVKIGVGVFKVEGTTEEGPLGEKVAFLRLTSISRAGTHLVPLRKQDLLRPLSSPETAHKAIEILRNPCPNKSGATGGSAVNVKRQGQNITRVLKSGDLIDLATLACDLWKNPGTSKYFNIPKQTIAQYIAEELSLILGKTLEDMKAEVIGFLAE